MRNYLTITVLLALIHGFVFGQFSISGKVTDKTSSEPLSGAQVRLENTFIVTTTDNTGFYGLKKIAAGHYILKISFLGYKEFRTEVDLKSDLVINAEIPRTSIMSEEVIIMATRVPDKAPATITTISHNEIEKLNTGKDLPILIENTPSVVTTSDAGNGIGYTGIRIRGTDMTRVNVTLNGVPFNDPESHEVYWVDIPDIASSIDNMQIQRGVGTSTNGAASFGGSINIQTAKSSNEAYAKINSSYGSFNSFKNSIQIGSGLIDGKWAFDGRASKVSSNGYIDRASSDLKSYFLSGTYFAPTWYVKANVFSGKEKTYQAWDGIPSEILDTNRTYNMNGIYYDKNGNTQFYRNENDNYQQDHYQLLFSKELPGHFSLNAALFYIHGEGYYEEYEQGNNSSYYSLLPLPGNPDTSIDLITQKWLKNDFYGFTYSVEKEYHSLHFTIGGAWNKYIGDHFGKVIWTSLPFQQNTFDYEWYRSRGDKNDFNIFGKVRYQATKKLSLFGDLQYRSINYSITGIEEDITRNPAQSHTYQFINPKAGIFLDLNQQNNLQLSVAIANREPTRGNFTDADPGITPKPEQLINYELGYHYQAQNFTAGLNLFYMDYKDQLILTGKINDVGSPVMVNVPGSYRAGIELNLGLRMAEKLTWDANLSLSSNKIRNFIEYVDDWDNGGQIEIIHGNTDIAFSPSVVGGSVLNYQITKKLTCGLMSKFVGKQFYDNTGSSDRELNSYFINNLIIGYEVKPKFVKNIGFNLQLNNIFNVKYESNAWVYRYSENGAFNKMDGFYPQAGLNFMIAMHVDF